MVLDEEALEAMLARSRKAEGHDGADMKTTDATDEFEVYERQAPRPEAEPAQEPTPEPVVDEESFEVYEKHAPVMEEPEPAPMPEPVPEPVPEPETAPDVVREPEPMAEPEVPAAPRRPEVWPPIRSHKPKESEAAATPAPQATVRGDGARLAILQATFNAELTDMMTDLARQKAERLGADVVAHERCHGVYDMPLLAQRLLRRDDVDALVVIGVVVQGETSHDALITHATAKSLQEVSLATDKPIGLGITGPGMTWKQAEARIANAAHAVEAVLAMRLA